LPFGKNAGSILARFNVLLKCCVVAMKGCAFFGVCNLTLHTLFFEEEKEMADNQPDQNNNQKWSDFVAKMFFIGLAVISALSAYWYYSSFIDNSTAPTTTLFLAIGLFIATFVGGFIILGVLASALQKAQMGPKKADILMLVLIGAICLALIVIILFSNNPFSSSNSSSGDDIGGASISDYDSDYDSDSDDDYSTDWDSYDYDNDGEISQGEWEDALGDYMDEVMP